MGRSRFGKWAVRALLALLGAAAVGAMGLYLLASRVPAVYRPAVLDSDQRQDSAKRFAGRMLGPEFGGRIQQPQPFELTFTESELNEYLASMDEIAALSPGGRSGQVRQVLARAGLEDPAIVLDGGDLVLMFRLRDYGKILSLKLSLECIGGTKLLVRLTGARLGEMSIPESVLRPELDRLRGALSSRSGEEGPASGGLSMGDVGAALANVVAAIDRQPIPTELPRKVNGRRFRIDAVQIRDKVIRLHFQPLAEP